MPPNTRSGAQHSAMHPETPHQEATETTRPDELWKMVSPHLNRITAASQRDIRIMGDKIAQRKTFFKTLENHKDKGTLPKGLIPMKVGQIPIFDSDSFAQQFKELAQRAASEALNLMISTRKSELIELQQEREMKITRLQSMAREALEYCKTLVPDLTNDDVSKLTDKYLDFIQSKLQAQEKRHSSLQPSRTLRNTPRKSRNV